MAKKGLDRLQNALFPFVWHVAWQRHELERWGHFISMDESTMSLMQIPRGLTSPCQHVPEHASVMYPLSRCYSEDENTGWWPCEPIIFFCFPGGILKFLAAAEVCGVHKLLLGQVLVSSVVVSKLLEEWLGAIFFCWDKHSNQKQLSREKAYSSSQVTAHY